MDEFILKSHLADISEMLTKYPKINYAQAAHMVGQANGLTHYQVVLLRTEWEKSRSTIH